MNKNLIIIILLSFLVLAYFASKNNFFTSPGETVNVSASKDMSFFITSVSPGKGGDLGGLAGADAYCGRLAEEAGVNGKVWVAYLSQEEKNGMMKVNAKDRIGNGPWKNFNGQIIANNVQELLRQNNLNKNTALTEKGEMVKGRGDTPNEHDILTGSDMNGNLYATSTDVTCNNWTSSETGSAIVGHHDRIGINDSEPMKSWSSSHLTRGCSLENFRSTGGSGLIYCFAK